MTKMRVRLPKSDLRLGKQALSCVTCQLYYYPANCTELWERIEIKMGFLKRFFKNVFHEQGPELTPSSFERLSEEELEAHLGVQRYGDFKLTEAIRPSYDLKVKPAQGFRHDFYRDEETKADVSVLMAAATREIVFELFMEMIEPLGNVVDVVLETSHCNQGSGHDDLYREHIDMPVLKSILWDYEDLLMDDGCTGIAVLNPRVPQEVQFDEHKLLIAYGDPLNYFEQILKDRDVACNDQMRFITEAEHVHSSNKVFVQQFDELKTRLGMDAAITL